MKGTVKKEGSSWYYRLYIGVDPATQKKIYKKKRGFKTKKEADSALTKLKYELERGTHIGDENMTIAEYMEYFKKQYVEKNCAATTARRYNFSINDINEYLGNVKLSKLNPLQVQQFYDDVVEDKGQSQSTLLKTHRTFHLALQCALKWRLINTNICDLIVKPKPVKVDIEFWKANECHYNLERLDIPKWLRNIATLALQTGMREGELCALKWDSVDLINGTLHVKENRKRDENNILIDGPTKNKRNRVITLFPASIELLKELKQTVGKVIRLNNNSDYVFTYTDKRHYGEPIDPHTLCQKFSEAVKSCDEVKDKITFHGLRHTHATMLLAAGVNIKVLSERLGHSTISITLDTYVHIDQDLQRKEMQKALDLF